MRYPAVRLVALLSSLSTTSENSCSTILLVEVCSISSISLFNPSLLVSPSLPGVLDIYIYIIVYKYYYLIVYILLYYCIYITVYIFVYIYIYVRYTNLVYTRHHQHNV